MGDLRDLSKRVYGVRNPDTPTQEELTLGALQRMADSLEKMEKPFLNLLDQAKLYRELYEKESRKRERLERRNRALRAWNTRYRDALRNREKQ